ncbi:ADP-ribosylglycohydrolase family protein [Pseudomonas fluorescens]|uniref:ADP-ribosylglycohydrolase family protein n=1 Tax=Pseudomonas fluorescens TaxID=294 RepID=UPI0014752279|nr:ADP-ribosylglycohydrolase family protein [Pseudomonas fluorescens]NNB69309.1 ADP-ribosylglycohydrolase family protein [Pseudomonas fluorescens]
MSNDRLKRSISSATWSAYADALGFPTELASDKIVQQRLGHATITRTESWKRMIGGRFGATVTLPAGAYSDDTQLRLSTCRSIRGDGYFDVEAFAKIELTVWQAYALGAGRGSKAAAAALCNRSNTWFSNFFPGYTNGGGNGAAMRVQPHVWAAADLTNKETYIPDVIRNAVCTHGHVRGIAGAVVHAISLAHTFVQGKAPGPDSWIGLANDIRQISDYIAADNDLATFWLPTWEKTSNQTLSSAVDVVANEWEQSVKNAIDIIKLDRLTAYERIVKSEGGLTREERGSGLKCALFANVAAWLSPVSGAQKTIEHVVNLLDSDTDTIATMAGALIGAAYPDASPIGPIQDDRYVTEQAQRLYNISQGMVTPSFIYPDLLYWLPPKTAIDIISIKNGKIILDGLGEVRPLGNPYNGGQKSTQWQWFRLSIGQTILSKFRSTIFASVDNNNLTHVETFQAKPNTQDLFDNNPSNGYLSNISDKKNEIPEISTASNPELSEELLSTTKNNTIKSIERDALREKLLRAEIKPRNEKIQTESPLSTENLPFDLDTMTTEAISSGFNANLIGTQLLRLMEEPAGIELSIAYAAIIAKARKARLKQRNKT